MHTTLSNLKGLFLCVADEVDEIVNFSGCVPQSELLLLTIAADFLLVFDQFIKLLLDAEIAGFVTLLVHIEHGLAHMFDILSDLAEFPGLFVIDILHVGALHVLPFKLVHQLGGPEHRLLIRVRSATAR